MAIARFRASKSVRLPTLIEPSVMPRPVSNRGSSPVPDGDRAPTNQADMSSHGQGLQRHHDRARPADLDDAIDATAIGQLVRLLVPIRRLGVVDHVGSPQRLEPFGLLGGRRCRNHPSAQHPGSDCLRAPIDPRVWRRRDRRAGAQPWQAAGLPRRLPHRRRTIRNGCAIFRGLVLDQHLGRVVKAARAAAVKTGSKRKIAP